jgi:hypothetical protein
MNWSTAVRERDYWIEWRTRDFGYVVRRVKLYADQSNLAQYDSIEIRDIRPGALREAIEFLRSKP